MYAFEARLWESQEPLPRVIAPGWPCLPSSPLTLRGGLLWAQEIIQVGQGSPATHATELADSRALNRDQNWRSPKLPHVTAAGKGEALGKW